MPSRLFRVFAPVVILSACASGPTLRYFPPQAVLKELQQQPNGQWQAQIRIQNFSTGAMDFSEIRLKIQIQDERWLELSGPATLNIGASNAEVLSLNAPFSPDTLRVIQERQDKVQPLRYRLEGSLRSRDPNRTYPLTYEGRVNPAPGLSGVYR